MEDSHGVAKLSKQQQMIALPIYPLIFEKIPITQFGNPDGHVGVRGLQLDIKLQQPNLVPFTIVGTILLVSQGGRPGDGAYMGQLVCKIESTRVEVGVREG